MCIILYLLFVILNTMIQGGTMKFYGHVASAETDKLACLDIMQISVLLSCWPMFVVHIVVHT